jgi:hypothetical protein
VQRVLATRIFASGIVCALALSISLLWYGQATGSLSGAVLDKSGASISGVTGAAGWPPIDVLGLARFESSKS